MLFAEKPFAVIQPLHVNQILSVELNLVCLYICFVMYAANYDGNPKRDHKFLIFTVC